MQDKIHRFVLDAIRQHPFNPRQASPVLKVPVVMHGDRGIFTVDPPKLTGPVRAVEPHLGVEIGCAEGMMSKLLLESFPKLSMYLVDSYCLAGDGDRNISKSGRCERCVTAESIAASFNGRATVLRLSSEQAAQRLGGRKFDFVIVDGDDCRSGIESDVKTWFPRLADGGILLFPRFGNPGMGDVIQDVVGRNPDTAKNGVAVYVRWRDDP